MKKISKILILLLLQTLFMSHAAYSADQVFFYVTDPVGTPLAMTDPSGNIVWKADYKPFGEENSIVSDQKNNKEFVGKEKDEETGIYYFNARYMDPRIGRFVAVDPVKAVDPYNNQTNEKMLTNPQHLNNYAYAQNNPVNFIDPRGLEFFLIGDDTILLRPVPEEAVPEPTPGPIPETTPKPDLKKPGTLRNPDRTPKEPYDQYDQLRKAKTRRGSDDEQVGKPKAPIDGTGKSKQNVKNWLRSFKNNN